MRKVILQPSGNKDAREHYENTIQKPVTIELLAEYISEDDRQILKSFYPNGTVPTWGVTPGKKDVNIKKWEKIQVGDVTLFSANGHIFGSGVVTHKLHHKELASNLWGYNDEGQTWEYVYFLDELKQHRIPYSQFNQIVRYADNFVIQGISVLNEERSERILTVFDLKSEVYLPEVTEEEFEEEVLKFDPEDDLDTNHSGKGRKEQPFLRKQLFKNRKFGYCGICGKHYPVNMLVAAHIKKRAKCSREERLDHLNIVMPMCKFGCDDLYERGYIFLKDGIIHRNQSKPATADLLKKIDEIEGQISSHWNENTKKYFEWHEASQNLIATH
ncbi:MAG: HNH endonuclease [Paenibacillus sp.]|nr:HNH endonuclease [Paenibacillus sp.]